MLETITERSPKPRSEFRRRAARIFKLLSIALAVISLVAFIYFKNQRYEIVITQEMIDEGISNRFPATKRHLLFITITYSNPKVILLEESDRVQIRLDATLNLRLKEEEKMLGGSATLTSGIQYDNKTHAFFLVDTELDRLDIQGVPDRWLDQVTKLATAAAREFIQTKPVYTLKTKDKKTAAAKLLLKGVEIRNQAIHVTLGI